MIRRLGEGDRASVITLLSAAPQLNLYMLGNLHTYGFDTDFCEYFGDVEDGHLRGLVNRYATGWTVFGEGAADWAGLGALVDSHVVEAERLQDNPGGIESFLPFLQRYEASNLAIDHLMELPDGSLQPQSAPDGFVVRKATMDDLAGLVAFFSDAGDMSRTPASTERPLRDRRVWIALKDGEIISAALTNAENDTLGMIGGVYTVPAWRGLGLSQAVCSGLCQELIETGRQPVLYWDNPAAGRVYTKLGFRKIGTWRSVRLTTR
jgi:hypothetical protein